MHSLTGRVRRMIFDALTGIPAHETVGYDAYIERRPGQGPNALALVIVLAVPNPQLGQPQLIATTDAPGISPDQETVTRIVSDGVLFLRGQQRALLS